jgi:hypothetical protein
VTEVVKKQVILVKEKVKDENGKEVEKFVVKKVTK